MKAAVVVTGMGVVCSIAADAPSFEAALLAGRSGIARATTGSGEAFLSAELRDFELDAALAARPATLRKAARRAAGRAPLGVGVAVAAAVEGWESAGLLSVAPPAEKLGLVVAGNNLAGRYAWDLQPTYLGQPAYLSPRFALHCQDTDHVGVLSQVLGIQGEGFTVGGASASGNLAILHGGRLVEQGAVDACLVVGAMTDLSPMERQGFANLGAMAPAEAGVCRPFDRGRQGFVYGQGAACLVLELEPSARRRGAAILAELAGAAQCLDGRAQAEPSEEGEVRVMTAALRHAGRAAGDVTCVNTHGTGSPLGDEIEARALRRVFPAPSDRPWINATKSLTGHCLSAAGVVEAVATVIQMRAGFVHGNPFLEQPIDPRLRFVGRSAESAEIDCVLSNAFGFGGFNSSVVFVRRG